MVNKKLSVAVAAALAVGGASAVHASPQFEAGDWTVTFDGNVNGFYTQTDCATRNAPVGGGLACTSGAGDVNSDQANVRTGLLPAKLGTSIATRQAGYDIEAYLSYWPGVDDGLGGNALGANSANFRQVYLTFGNDQMGTVKIGRDLGIFGSDAILNDQTLLGVGAVSDFTLRGGRTSLGGIGTGYIYADWKAQISYWSPDFAGFSFALGVMDPWDAGSLGNVVVPGVSAVGNDQRAPGFEGKVNYTWTGPVDGNIWASVATQRVNAGPIDSETAYAYDVGASVDIVDLNVTGYYYRGKGAGTTGFLLDGFDSTGSRRDSDGGYVQVGYRVPGPNTLISAAYGVSRLDDNSPDPDTLLDKNERVTLGIYHPLTPSLNLVAEGNLVQAENHDGDTNHERTIALGGILFF